MKIFAAILIVFALASCGEEPSNKKEVILARMTKLGATPTAKVVVEEEWAPCHDCGAIYRKWSLNKVTTVRAYAGDFLGVGATEISQGVFKLPYSPMYFNERPRLKDIQRLCSPCFIRLKRSLTKESP